MGKKFAIEGINFTFCGLCEGKSIEGKAQAFELNSFLPIGFITTDNIFTKSFALSYNRSNWSVRLDCKARI